MQSKVKYALLIVLTVTALLPIAFYIISDKKPKDSTVTKEAPTPGTTSIYLLNTKMSSANEVCSQVYPVKRNLDSKNPKKVAETLVQGPTSEEKIQGYFSPYDFELIDAVKEVKIRDGVVYITFSDFSGTLQNTGTMRTITNAQEIIAAPSGSPIMPKSLPQCGATALHTMITTTYKNIYEAQSVIFSFNGNIAQYYKWAGTPCPANKEICEEKIEVASNAQATLQEKSLLKNSVKLSVPEQWSTSESNEVKITNQDQAAPITITVSKNPGNQYECPQKMNNICEKVTINNNEWQRSQYHEMNGIVIEIGKVVKNNVLKVRIETPYRTQNAEGMSLVQKIIESTQI